MDGRINRIILNESKFHLLVDNKIYIKPSGSVPKLMIGQELNISYDMAIESPCYIAGTNLYTMGAFSYSHSAFPANSIIGRYVSIASNVRIFKPDHPMDRFTTSAITYNTDFPMFRNYYSSKDFTFERVPFKEDKRIVIGNDVWIGSHVALKPGITIGNGAVIATGAVVTKDVEPYSVVGGVPARHIKYRFSDEIINDLMSINWWEYDCADFDISADIPVKEFISYFSDRKNELNKMTPKVILGRQLID